MHALLLREGPACARRTMQRVRRAEGLDITGPARRPKCPPRPKAKMKAEGVNDVWCVDLVFDVTQRGTTVKFLTIIDEGPQVLRTMALPTGIRHTFESLDGV